MAKTVDLDSLLLGLSEKVAQAATAPNINRYEPYEQQTSFHKATEKGRLFIGGNRTGKTVSNVVECIWWLTKTHPYRKMPEGPVRGRLVCVSLTEGLEKIIIPLFKQWLPNKWLINGSWSDSYDKSLRTLTLVNGSFIEFMSYDQDLEKFAGTSRHFISFDEEPQKDIWIECRARLIDTGGSWWISMTPVEGLTWVYEDIYEPWENDSTSSRYFVITADMTDNPHISQEEIDEFLEGLDEEEKLARKSGKFINLGGLVFKKFNSDVHKVDFDFKVTKEMRVYTSVDVGWAHPTAWLWHAVEPNGHITTFHEMIDSGITIEEWSKKVLQYERENKLEIYLRTGDPALNQTRSNTGVSDVTEYAKNGIYLALENVPREVNIGLVKIEQYMKPDSNPQEEGRPYWQYTENCVILEKQMRKLRWDTYASKKMISEKGPKGTIRKVDDDGPDSLRYFMTLMPDLKFDNIKGVPQNPGNALGASRMFDTDFRMDSMYMKDLWEPAPDTVWDLEG